jgi:hypothetical protein
MCVWLSVHTHYGIDKNGFSVVIFIIILLDIHVYMCMYVCMCM